MGYQTVRALVVIKHDGVDRKPGVTSGKSNQDFVVTDAVADRLSGAGLAAKRGSAPAPVVRVPVGQMVAQYRDGQFLGLTDGRGQSLSQRRQRSAHSAAVLGDSRNANNQAPAGAFAWSRNVRNIYRAIDGELYLTGTANHGLPDQAWIYFWDIGISSFEINNRQLQIRTLDAVPQDVQDYVALPANGGGVATTANTVRVLDAPYAANTRLADAGKYTLDMQFGMAGSFSYANFFLDHQFDEVINLALGGMKLADFLARMDVYREVAARVQLCHINLLTNDLTGWADNQSVVDVAVGQYKQAIMALLDEGPLVGVANMIPWVTMSATQLKNLDRVNRALSAEIFSLDGVVGFDHYSAIALPGTGLASPADNFTDQFHTKGNGTFLLGLAEARALRPFYPRARPRRVTGNAAGTANRLTNPRMQGSAGLSMVPGSAAVEAANAGVADGWRLMTCSGGVKTGVGYSTIQPWKQSGNPVPWSADTAHAQWSTIRPLNSSDFCYVAQAVAGDAKTATDPANQPVWPTKLFDTVVDNNVTWMCVPMISDAKKTLYQCARIVAGAGLLDNSPVRLEQQGIALAALSGDAALSPGSTCSFSGRVKLIRGAFQGWNAYIRPEQTIDTNFCYGRDLAKSDFLDGKMVASKLPLEGVVGTHPSWHVPPPVTSLVVGFEFVMGPASEIVFAVAEAEL